MGAGIVRARLCAALVGVLALTGCGRAAGLRLFGAYSYAKTYASEPTLIFEEVKSPFTNPFALETAPAKALIKKIESGKAEGALVRDVPFYMQTEHGCGSAALAGVLSFYGATVKLGEIIQQTVVPEIGGTLCTDMVAYPRTRGFWSEQHPGTSEALRSHLAAGRPVVCLLGTGSTCFGGHYITVTAYAPGEGVLCHNGHKPDVYMSWKRFDTFWSASHRWMLIICPPENVDWELSAKLKNEFGRVLHRRKRWEKALKSYEAALKSETKVSSKARMTYNTGLTHFALGRLDKAKEAFSKALELDPDLPDAANALAFTYATLGANLEEAEALARKALEAEPRHEALYLDTLGFVLHRLGKDAEALKTLHKALKKAPPGDKEMLAEIHYHLGLSSGSDPKARGAALKKAVELAPEGISGKRASALLKRMRQKAGKSD
jgi:Tfp pilus assembly protein PilF